MSTPLVSLVEAGKNYGELAALNAMTMSLNEGEVLGLLGPNGAGKTTTLRAICGMIETHGDVRLFGESIIGKTPEAIARMGVAHVPDGRGTFSGMTVLDNLRLGALSAKKLAMTKGNLTQSSGFKGVNGVFRFKADGTNQRAMAIAQVTNNQVQIIDPAPKSFGFGGF